MKEIMLFISIVICFILLYLIRKKSSEEKVCNMMSLLFLLLIVWCIGLLLQIYGIKYLPNIKPIYFDYITYIGICFTPPTALLMALAYFDKKVSLRVKILINIIPILCLLILWTNDYHHLFYETYSTNFNDTLYGPIFNINRFYCYILMVLFLVIMAVQSIKKSGFFSKQTGLIFLGSIIPLIINILGTVRVINISIYVTPILFVITLICYAISIIKYKALNIVPVALRTIMDTMSDGFVVISKDGTVVDKNNTFDKTFSLIFKDNNIMGSQDNLYYLIRDNNVESLFDLKDNIKQAQSSKKMVTKEYHIISEEYDKYFETDIQPVLSKRGNEYIGTLLLFKDITQHKKDIKEIEEKQEIIVKQGQLVSIGELAGGMAHDINTPISAIKSGILMFREMLGKRSEEEMELLQRMDNCADKIIKIVNSMRNQIRNLGGDTNVEFKIQDVINDIKVLVYNELIKNNCELQVEIEDDLAVKGDPTKLGQVLTNLVVNAIQAYKDKGGKVEVILTKAPENMAMIKVIDYAGGMDESIKPYIFKNILTTKGTIGTGLGLYLAYSVIKGKFGGDITFASEQGVGTTFYITIPRV